MIRFDNVAFSYENTKVFEGLSLEIPETGITALVAPSGRGKTTLLRLIAGLEKPSAGKISGLPNRVSYVFQEQRLLPWYSALDNIKAVLSDVSVTASSAGVMALSFGSRVESILPCSAFTIRP